MLLVMDDFEELIEAADFLAELLKAAPKLQMIVTSHERLNLREEWVVEVAGLQFPKAGETDRIEDYAAVQLFVQGAQRVNLRFSLTDADAPHVLRICELTGGIPLGIELASAWARMLSCREIAEEIGTSIDFLAGSVREGSGEMGSLRAVFEHSWNFLLQEEKGVFQRIAVFPWRPTKGGGRKVWQGIPSHTSHC